MPPPTGGGGGGGGTGGGEVGQQRQGQQQQQGGMGQTITGIIRMAVFWYFISKFISPKKAPTDPSILISNLFQKGESLVCIFHVLVFFVLIWALFFPLTFVFILKKF
jgi:hypothetical protein